MSVLMSMTARSRGSWEGHSVPRASPYTGWVSAAGPTPSRRAPFSAEAHREAAPGSSPALPPLAAPLADLREGFNPEGFGAGSERTTQPSGQIPFEDRLG